jgi:hypothetical protein
MSYPCPQCHDRYTRSLPMVHNSGISNWTSQRGLASGSQTVLSRMTSPPGPRGARGAYLLLLVTMLPIAGLLFVAGIVRSNASVGRQVNPAAPIIDGPTARSHPLRRGVARRIPHAAPTRPTTPNTPPVPALHPPDSLGNRLVGYAFCALLILGWGALVVAAIRRIRNTNKYNRTVWPQEMQRWRSSFLCRACGFVFIP